MTDYLPVDDRDPDDERETHRVAIVVFMETKGVDAMDAAHRAEIVLRSIIHRSGTPDPRYHYPVTVDLDSSAEPRPGFSPSGHYIRALIHEIKEVGMAVGNGDLWMRVTRKAFPRED